MYRESPSNVLCLKYTENRPQMYKSASNVQRIGLKCTDQQISNFWSIYLSIWCVYLSISFAKIYLCTFEADLYIWGRFSVHLRPIFVCTFEADRTLPHLSRARASNPWASLADFTADRTTLPGRGAVESDPPQVYVHLRPIPYIWGQFSVHLRPILCCTFEAESASNVQLSDWLRQTLPLSDGLRQITWQICLKCTENRPQMYGIGLKCIENWPQMYRESASNVQKSLSEPIRELYIWGRSVHLRPICNFLTFDSISYQMC